MIDWIPKIRSNLLISAYTLQSALLRTSGKKRSVVLVSPLSLWSDKIQSNIVLRSFLDTEMLINVIQNLEKQETQTHLALSKTYLAEWGL